MNDNKNIPYLVYESAEVKAERTIKRLIYVIVLLIILFFTSNMFWLYQTTKFETINYAQDGQGLNNINNGSQGDVNGAEAEN